MNEQFLPEFFEGIVGQIHDQVTGAPPQTQQVAYSGPQSNFQWQMIDGRYQLVPTSVNTAQPGAGYPGAGGTQGPAPSPQPQAYVETAPGVYSIAPPPAAPAPTAPTGSAPVSSGVPSAPAPTSYSPEDRLAQRRAAADEAGYTSSDTPTDAVRGGGFGGQRFAGGGSVDPRMSSRWANIKAAVGSR